MSDDTALTDEELAILRAHGYEPAGGGNINGDGVIWLKFRRRDGTIEQATRSEWRLVIAGFQRPAIEDADLAQRLEVLKAILADPANQAGMTPDGRYIYSFDLETMRQIADAIGVPRGDPVEVFNLEDESETRICVSCEKPKPATDTLDKDLCDACVTAAYQHKPELYAQISLEGGGTYTQPLDTLSVAIDAELDGAEVGTELTITIVSMTPAEYAALPEFDGH